MMFTLKGIESRKTKSFHAQSEERKNSFIKRKKKSAVHYRRVSVYFIGVDRVSRAFTFEIREKPRRASEFYMHELQRIPYTRPFLALSSLTRSTWLAPASSATTWRHLLHSARGERLNEAYCGIFFFFYARAELQIYNIIEIESYWVIKTGLILSLIF